MASASDREFPKSYLVWSRKINGIEDFVQLYYTQKCGTNEREFLIEWNRLLQEKSQKDIFTTYPLTARLAITKDEIMPLSVGNIAESFYSSPRLHYNTLRNCFTAGLLMVEPGKQHTINCKDGYVDIYICRDSEKRWRYRNNANCGKVLINEKQIREDFLSPQPVMPKEPFDLLENSVYFFYARDLSSFTVVSQGDNVMFRCDTSFMSFMKMYSGPLGKSYLKGTTGSSSTASPKKSYEDIARDLENVKNENMKLKAVLRRVRQLTDDVL